MNKVNPLTEAEIRRAAYLRTEYSKCAKSAHFKLDTSPKKVKVSSFPEPRSEGEFEPVSTDVEINVSNHPVEKWSDKQVEASGRCRNSIRDIPFPNVPPTATHEEIKSLAEDILCQVKGMQPCGCRVMVQGEFTLTHELVKQLQQGGYTPCVATSERTVRENSDGTKTVQFNFVQFRDYTGATRRGDSNAK